MNNPIIDEIRQARADLAAEHDYDLVRINEWARKQTEAYMKLHFRSESQITLEPGVPLEGEGLKASISPVIRPQVYAASA